MTRRRRDYLPHLRAFWRVRFPGRPEKLDFADEVLVAVDLLMRQIDPAGTRPVTLPDMPADGYEPQLSVKSSGRRLEE